MSRTYKQYKVQQQGSVLPSSMQMQLFFPKNEKKNI